jgi:hypothetical protein
MMNAGMTISEAISCLPNSDRVMINRRGIKPTIEYVYEDEPAESRLQFAPLAITDNTKKRPYIHVQATVEMYFVDRLDLIKDKKVGEIERILLEEAYRRTFPGYDPRKGCLSSVFDIVIDKTIEKFGFFSEVTFLRKIVWEG